LHRLFAAAAIGLTAWAVGAMDGWFSKQEGVFSMVHMLIWFPVAFAVWALVPAFVVSRLARDGSSAEPIS
jgi:hypothetical protein